LLDECEMRSEEAENSNEEDNDNVMEDIPVLHHSEVQEATNKGYDAPLYSNVNLCDVPSTSREIVHNILKTPPKYNLRRRSLDSILSEENLSNKQELINLES